MKTSELQGAALDWAVAKVMQDDTIGVYFNENGRPMRDMARHGYGFDSWEPSTDWAQGGPIIEREGITITPYSIHNGVIREWKAGRDWPMSHSPYYFGTTPLIAAMRCYVASVLGNEVEMPNEVGST